MKFGVKEKERQKLYKRWERFNLDEDSKAIMALSLLYPKVSALLLFLVYQMDEHNVVTCSYQEMQDKFEVGKATIARGIKVLKDGGYITALKTGQASVYVVNENTLLKKYLKLYSGRENINVKINVGQ